MSSDDVTDRDAIRATSAEQTDEATQAQEIASAALAEYAKQTEHEAGRPEGRIFQEFAAGAQVYPDPGMWGPDTGGVPLTEAEHYGRVASLLDRIDREDGFDGRLGS